MECRETTTLEDFSAIARLFLELDCIIQTAAKGRMDGITPITLKLPVSEPAIHAFYTTVSWLYVLIIECGPVHFRFLAERASSLGLDTAGKLPSFCSDIQMFRTVLQHNLDINDADDLAKLVRFESWTADILKIPFAYSDRFWPKTHLQWQELNRALRDRAMDFGETNINTAKRILQDEFADDVIREWTLRQTRSLPAHEFDTIVAQAAADLGLQYIDALSLRKAHLSEWNRRLRLLAPGLDGKREARRLIEQTLLAEADNYMPITGADVIERLNVSPGPEVGKILRQARELYRKERCSKEDLLRQLSRI